MSKRHNRKRTRSRPRHRDGKPHPNHNRTLSLDTNASIPTSFPFFPAANPPSDYWHQTYSAWQGRVHLEQEQQREQQRTLEAQRLRFFGGEVGDEASLLEPMLKVVTDLFDGMTDYEDP